MIYVESINPIYSNCAALPQDAKRLPFSGPYFVRFTDINKSVKESFSKEILIEVHQAGPAPQNDLIINYEISGNARAGIDYKINGTVGKVVIKKGEYVGNISVSLINNSNNIIRSRFLLLHLHQPTIRIEK